MDHELPGHFGNERFLDCGDVSLIIKDPDGLAHLLHEADFNFTLLEGTFTAEQLRTVTDSTLLFIAGDETHARALDGVIHYAPDVERATTHQDLFDVFDHLVFQCSYEFDSFQLVDNETPTPKFVLTLADGSTVRVMTVPRHTSENPDDITPAGRLVLRYEFPLERDPETDYSGLEQVLHLWGDLHSAIPQDEGGKHAKRTEQPVEIVVQRFRQSDGAHLLWQVLSGYEHEQREQTDATWPALDMQAIDTETLSARFPWLDEASLREALARLILQKRREYGASGVMPAITQTDLIQALGDHTPGL